MRKRRNDSVLWLLGFLIGLSVVLLTAGCATRPRSFNPNYGSIRAEHPYAGSIRHDSHQRQ